MDKQLQTIQEENVENERPKSAKQQKFTDRYTKLDEKHKGIKKKLKNYKTGNRSYADGSFNNFFKVNSKIGVIKSKEDDIANKEFNSIFVSSLLEICGEKTIDSGKEQTNIYVDLAKNDLMYETADMLHQYGLFLIDGGLPKMMDEKNFKKLSKNEQTLFKCFLFIDLFDTGNFLSELDPILKDSSVACNFLSNKLKEQEELSFASRLLCKIFLLQMFDRKANNVVVMEDKDGKIDFCEIDFDDNQITDEDSGDKGFISNIFCKFISQNDKLNTEMSSEWRKRLQYLKKHYDKIIIKNKSIKTSFAKMIKNYTMTHEKIEELIKKTALKAKYMGLSEEEVIKGINEKIKLWKEMLNDKENGEIVNQIEGIKEAREQTLTALNQITEEKVAEIVHKIMMMHDLAYDKPDERKIKDNNDLLNEDKTNEDIASKAEKMVLAEKSRISNMQQQASFISRFVSDGREIQTGDITANNLISYFKLEKDRSRSFFWMFGQRNKRFNALCETLEKLWKEKSNNDIRIDENFLRNEDNMEQDENLIRNLFPDDQQQGNNANQEIQNNRPQLKTEQVKQRIVDRLNQVGCFSCG